MRVPIVSWSRRLLLAALPLAAGCGMQGVVGPAEEPAATSSPPVGVEVAALKAAYELEGHQRPVLFVEVAGASPVEFDDIVAQLETALNVIVRATPEAVRDHPDLPLLTPYDPQSGQLGVVLRVDRTTPLEADTYQVDIVYSRSGLDGGSLSVTVTQSASEWNVADVDVTAVAKSVG
jgi:hypothetical protein